MRHPFAKSCCLWIALVLSVIPAMVRAVEVSNPTDGFHFSLPDDFVLDPDPEGKKEGVLYLYTRPPKDADQATAVVELRVLMTYLPVGKRLDPAKIVPEEGFTVSLEEIEWQGQTLDLMVSKSEDPAEANKVLYSVMFPLSGQPVRLMVGGATSGENAARPIFDKILASFTNTRPLQMPYDPSAASRAAERKGKMIFWVILMVAFTVIMVSLAAGKKKKRPKAGPPQVGPPVIRRPQ